MSEFRRWLGDPLDAANPFGYAEIVAADERATVSEPLERLMFTRGYGAELMADGTLSYRRAGALLAPLFGREPALAAWFCQQLLATALLAAGGAQSAVAALRDGSYRGRGVATTFDAAGRKPAGPRLVLTEGVAEGGTGPVAADRADWILASVAGADHRYALVPITAPGSVCWGAELPMGAQRGLRLAALEVRRVPAETIDIPPADELRVRAGVLAATLVGVLGGYRAWRGLVEHFTAHRVLYGRPIMELPLVEDQCRQVGDLLDRAEAASLAAADAADAGSADAATAAWWAHDLTADLAGQAATLLTTVLGARGFLREGDYGMAQKFQRDLPLSLLGDRARLRSRAALVGTHGATSPASSHPTPLPFLPSES